MDLALAFSAWQHAPAVSASERRFSEAVHEHRGVLHGIARRMCGNDADAQDLVHDTYERALRAWDRYSDSGSLRGWLVSIQHNLFIDYCRKKRRVLSTEASHLLDVPAPEIVAPPAWACVSDEQVAAALAAIGDEFRQVYELHAAGRSYDDIARELGIAKNTVGTRLLRARKKLKAALQRVIGDVT